MQYENTGFGVRVCVRSVAQSNPLWPHRLQPTRFLSMGFSWKEYWSGLPFPLPGDSQPWDQTQVSCISGNGRRILYQWATWEDLESESPGQILALPLLDLYKDNAHWEGLCEDKGQDGWTVPLGWSATSELNTCFVPFCIFFSLFVWFIYLESELVTQLYLTLCDPVDCSPPGSSVHGISQVRILECVAISFSRGSSPPRDWTWVSRIAGKLFTDLASLVNVQ